MEQFQRQLNDKVNTHDGGSGVITHCGIDAGGEIYLVQWKKTDGSINNRWYRNSEILM